MRNVSVSLPLRALIVPLFLAAVFTLWPKQASWLNFVFHVFSSKTLYPCLYVYFIWSWFLHLLPLLMRSCFRFVIISQSTWWRQFIIESRPNISWAGVNCVVVWNVILRANMVGANILFHGFSSSSTMLKFWACVKNYQLFSALFLVFRSLGDSWR